MTDLGKATTNRILMIIAIIGFLTGLAAYGYMGSFMRIIGDDYCYGGVLRAYGFWEAQIQAYFNKMPFHGNRYTLTLASTFFSMFPPVVNGIIPSIAILIFVGGNYTLISVISRKWRLNLSLMGRLLSGLGIAFFTFWLAPTINQSLYFRSAMLPSTMPVILLLFLTAFMLTGPVWGWLDVVLSFIFAILNAGFSENGAAIQGMLAFLVFGLTLWKKFRSSLDSNLMLLKPLSTLVGTIVGVAIMWVSPSISTVRGEMDSFVLQALVLSLRHTFDFYLGTFRTVYLGAAAITFFGVLVFFLFLAGETFSHRAESASLRSFIVAILVTHVSTLALIFALMVPSAFTRNVYPDPRHMIAGMMIMVIALVITGVCLAGIVLKIVHRLGWSKNSLMVLISGVIMVVFSILYPVRYVSQITIQRSLFQYWAMQWDKRHAVIVQAAEAGQEAVHVMTLDHIVEDVGELCPQPEKCWYNGCAAQYYEIQVYADQPGWEEGLKNR